MVALLAEAAVLRAARRASLSRSSLEIAFASPRGTAAAAPRPSSASSASIGGRADPAIRRVGRALSPELVADSNARLPFPVPLSPSMTWTTTRPDGRRHRSGARHRRLGARHLRRGDGASRRADAAAGPPSQKDSPSISTARNICGRQAEASSTSIDRSGLPITRGRPVPTWVRVTKTRGAAEEVLEIPLIGCLALGRLECLERIDQVVEFLLLLAQPLLLARQVFGECLVARPAPGEAAQVGGFRHQGSAQVPPPGRRGDLAMPEPPGEHRDARRPEDHEGRHGGGDTPMATEPVLASPKRQPCAPSAPARTVNCVDADSNPAGSSTAHDSSATTSRPCKTLASHA